MTPRQRDDIEPRRACYVVDAEHTYFVSTIDYRNELAPSFNCIESGIRDLSRHRDGRFYGSYAAEKERITFTLCQHDIWPLPEGHAAVVDALKSGARPDEVYSFLCKRGLVT